MSKLTKVLLILMIVGLVFGGVGAVDAFKVWKGDINDTKDIKIGDLKNGDLYEGEIPYAYDVIAEQVTTSTYGPVPVSKTKSPYYLVQNENCFFVINVTAAADQGDFDKLADLSWDQIDGKIKDDPEPVKVSAQASKMPDEVKKYLKEYCDEWGMSDSDYAELVEESCYLHTVNYNSMRYIPIAGFGVAILCVVILIIKKVTAPKIVNL
jgi:hypothetical protein